MHDAALPVLGIAGLLGIISFLPPLAARLRLPFAVLLALVGVALGLLVSLMRGSAGDGPLHDLLNSLGAMQPPAILILAIFVPPLLFEAALSLDVRRLWDDIGPILLLAIGAVLACSLAVGFTLFATFGLPLLACLLLGAIVSPTDPVAVVGIFRDIGAPRRLAVLVEGECLFNEASAIALFTLILAGITAGQEPSLGAAGRTLAVSFLGGIATGFVTGRIACLLLPLLRGWRMAEVTLTLTLAYLSFLIGDLYLHVSGGVAVVAAGLVFSAFGRTRVTPTSWETMVETWEQLAFWASALIFLFAALLIPHLLGGMEWRFLYQLGALFLAAFAARALVLFGLLPALGLLGGAERVEATYKTAILWGGLRGAVPLALAVAATEHHGLTTDLKQFIGVLTTGFVLLSLFLNGTTLHPLSKLLRLDRLSPAEQALRQRAFSRALSDLRTRIAEIGQREEIDPGIVAEVDAQIEHRADGTEATASTLTEQEQVQAGLATLCAHERALCLDAFRQQLLSGRMADDALAQIGRLTDGLKTDGREGYEAAAHAALGFPRFFRAILFLQYRFGITAPLARHLSHRFESLFAAEARVRDLLHFTHAELGALFGEAVEEILAQILHKRLDAIRQGLTALKLQFPDYAAALQRRDLGRIAWRLEDARYDSMLEEATITREVHADLSTELATRRAQLDRRPRLDVELEPAALLARVPLFKNLEPARLAAIARLLHPRFVMPDETIIHQGHAGTSMYFIASGAVEVRLQSGSVPLGSGDFVGEMALVTHQPRVASVVTLGFGRLLELRRADFERLIQSDETLRAHITTIARDRQTANTTNPD